MDFCDKNVKEENQFEKTKLIKEMKIHIVNESVHKLATNVAMRDDNNDIK